MASGTRSNLSLSLSKRQSPATPSSHPLLDNNLEDYVTWCVNRNVTSRKVIQSLDDKVSTLEKQLNDNEFPAWVLNKFKGLSSGSIVIEATIFTQNAITSAKEKRGKANSLLEEAKADLSDLVKTLQADVELAQTADLVQCRYNTVLSVRLSGVVAKNLREAKETAKKKLKNNETKAAADVSAEPIHAEEIGTIVQREVKRQVSQLTQKSSSASSIRSGRVQQQKSQKHPATAKSKRSQSAPRSSKNSKNSKNGGQARHEVKKKQNTATVRKHPTKR